MSRLRKTSPRLGKPTKAQIAARAKFVARFANASSAKKARSASGAPRVRKLGRNPVKAGAKRTPPRDGIRSYVLDAVGDKHLYTINYDETDLKKSRAHYNWWKERAYKAGGAVKPFKFVVEGEIKKNPSRRMPAPKGFVIRAQSPVKTGYKYYYLRGESFVLDSAHGDRFTKSGGEKRMREIHGALPRVISSITLVKV